MLEGADKDWSPPTEQRTINYANLASGRYQFRVRAVNANGVMSENPASVSFTIARPVWQQWWFLLLLTLLIIGLIYLVYSYRLKRLLELEKVRTRIATDLHDDIGASLSKIAVLSEVAAVANRRESSRSDQWRRTDVARNRAQSYHIVPRHSSARTC